MTTTKTVASTKTVRSAKAPKDVRPKTPKAVDPAQTMLAVAKPKRTRRAAPSTAIAPVVPVPANEPPTATLSPTEVGERSKRRTRTATTELVTTSTAREAIVRAAVAVAEDPGMVEALIGVGPTAVATETVLVREAETPNVISEDVAASKSARIAALATGAVKPSAPTDLGLVRALGKATADQRIALAAELGIKVVGLDRKVSAQRIAAEMERTGLARPSWLSKLAIAHVATPKAASPKSAKQPSEPKGGGRLDVIAECLARKGGATVKEIGEALLVAFPTRGPRKGFAPATLAEMRAYAHGALGHMQTGRVGKQQYTGRIVKTADRYSLAAK